MENSMEMGSFDENLGKFILDNETKGNFMGLANFAGRTAGNT